MAEHVWTVLCQKAPIDRDSNDLSLQSILEEVTLLEKPPEAEEGRVLIMFLPMTLVSLWTRSNVDKAEEDRCRYKMVGPKGQKLGLDRKKGSETPIDLTKHLRLRVRVQLPGLPYLGPGMYYFKVETPRGKTERWTTVATIPLRVVAKPRDAEEG